MESDDKGMCWKWRGRRKEPNCALTRLLKNKSVTTVLQNIIEFSFCTSTKQSLLYVCAKSHELFSKCSAAWQWATCQKCIFIVTLQENHFHFIFHTTVHSFYSIHQEWQPRFSLQSVIFSHRFLSGFLQLSSNNGSCFHIPLTTFPSRACQLWFLPDHTRMIWTSSEYRKKRRWIERNIQTENKGMCLFYIIKGELKIMKE